MFWQSWSYDMIWFDEFFCLLLNNLTFERFDNGNCSYHDYAFATSRGLHIVNLISPHATFKLLEGFFQHQVHMSHFPVFNHLFIRICYTTSISSFCCLFDCVIKLYVHLIFILIFFLNFSVDFLMFGCYDILFSW